MSPSKYMWTQNTWCPAMWWRFAGYHHLLEKLTRMTQNFPTVTPISNCQIIHQLARTCQQRWCCWEETTHEDETTAASERRSLHVLWFQACFCIVLSGEADSSGFKCSCLNSFELLKPFNGLITAHFHTGFIHVLFFLIICDFCSLYDPLLAF